MTERAIAFVESWVTENVRAQSDQSNGDNSQAQALATRCLNAATAEGIPQAEMAAAFDDLTAFVAGEIAEANDREVERLAAEEADD
jgi:hypothetical protein